MDRRFAEGWERSEGCYGKGSGQQERLCIPLSSDSQVLLGSIAACMDSSQRSRSWNSERGSQAAGLSAPEAAKSNDGRDGVLSRVSGARASVWVPAVHAIKPRTEQGGFHRGQADEH